MRGREHRAKSAKRAKRAHPFSQSKEGETNRRLNRLFVSLISSGREIVLDVADIDPFEINDIRFWAGHNRRLIQAARSRIHSDSDWIVPLNERPPSI